MIKTTNRIPIIVLISAAIMITLGLASAAMASWGQEYYTLGGCNNPVAVQDEDGHKFLVWVNTSGGYAQIVAQKLDSHGSELWADGGIYVHGTSALFEQNSPAAVSDGQGGLIVCWADTRVSTGVTALYTMRLDADGNELWSAGLRGHLVCNAEGNHWQPLLESDGEGGFYVMFHDDREGGTGVYAQHINQNGDQVWDPNGVRLRGTINDCSYMDVTTLPGGGASFVWQELRDSIFGTVWAQSINESGQLLWGYDGIRVLNDNVHHAYCRITHCTDDALMVGAVSFDEFIPAIEYTRLDLLTGQSMWGYTEHLPMVVGSATDFEMTPSHDGGVYMVLSSEENFVEANGALRIVKVRSDNSDVQKYYYQSHFDDITIGESTPDVLSIAWADPLTETISCVGFSFDQIAMPGWQSPQEVWFHEEFANATINGSISSSIMTDHGFLVTFTDGGDILATFIDFKGHENHYFPQIISVNDVPNDQGDWLSLTWLRSSLELASPSSISQYSLWMRAGNPDPAKAGTPGVDEVVKIAAGSGIAAAQVIEMMSSGWAYISVVPAYQQDSYSALVPSPANQSEAGSAATDYMVIAHDVQPWTFYRSGSMPGLAVDNLAPGAPAGLAGEFASGDVNLQWNAVYDGAHDLAGYQVYGSAVQGFVPSPETLLGDAITTDFVDVSFDGTRYYQVTARDVHGNEGQPSGEIEVTSGASSVGGLPTIFTLSDVYPNPFNPNTAFEFSLPAGSLVQVEIMDLRGNKVRSLISESLSAGTHTVRWNGQDDSGRLVASGAYFARVRSSFGMKTVKMVLAK